MGKRRFGRIRKLPSGRWQARYLGPDGIDRAAHRTFPTKADADIWLSGKEAEIRGGDWIDPDRGRVPFAEYASAWVEERPNLRPNTLQMYRYMLARHLLPAFGNRPVVEITEADVRRWRKSLLDQGAGTAAVAKAYRLIRAILNTAVDDGLMRRNPCRLKGASLDRSPERSVLTLRQVFGLADVIDPPYRALVLLAVFGSLRWGELAALRRRDVELDTGAVRVERSLTMLPGGGFEFGPPKSQAGKRTIVVPAILIPELRWHVTRFAMPGDDGLLFVTPAGSPLRENNFRRRVWLPALRKARLSDSTHIHDLRHTGNQLTASAGASLRELMDRMGHSSTRAALIHLHGSDARQREIADSLGQLARAEMKDHRKGKAAPGPRRRSGTQRARKGRDAS